MYTVIAHYRTAEADARTVREVLSRHAAASSAEPGCVTFTAHQHADDPTRFVLYEAYVDEAAFDHHRTTAHFRDNIERTVAPLLLERTWTVLSIIEPQDPEGTAGPR
jgi:(4S)-4-hydroxy-5-phosphonooxypentane-2,3-dione isomerase